MEGGFDRLPASVFSDELSEEERTLISRIHPAYMGGEYLPSYLPAEVEIARVFMHSVMWDVISVRARMGEDGLIHYRIADEYGENGKGRYLFQPETSELPLTLGELITMLDTAELTPEHNVGYTGLTSWRDKNYDWVVPDRIAIENLVGFIEVSSAFYPDLACWYEEEAQEWYHRKLGELEPREVQHGSRTGTDHRDE